MKIRRNPSAWTMLVGIPFAGDASVLEEVSQGPDDEGLDEAIERLAPLFDAYGYRVPHREQILLPIADHVRSFKYPPDAVEFLGNIDPRLAAWAMYHRIENYPSSDGNRIEFLAYNVETLAALPTLQQIAVIPEMMWSTFDDMLSDAGDLLFTDTRISGAPPSIRSYTDYYATSPSGSSSRYFTVLVSFPLRRPFQFHINYLGASAAAKRYNVPETLTKEINRMLTIVLDPARMSGRLP